MGIVGDPGEVDKYGQLVKNQVEKMCQEAFSKEMNELKEKMVGVLIHQIIHHKGSDVEKHISQYSTLLDVDLHTNRTCLLIDIYNLSEKASSGKGKDGVFGEFPLEYFQREVLNYLNLLLNETGDDIISVLNTERFIVIKTLPSAESYPYFVNGLDEKLEKLNSFLERKYRVRAAFSVGDISYGLLGIPESYQNAKKAMRIGNRTERESSIHVYNERDMMLRLLPTELPADYQKKLVNIISALIEHDNYDVLSSTFLAYCTYDMKLSETARNIFVHRNTLIYRLGRISDITSLDTGNFKHCMLLYTAIQCYEEQNTQKEPGHVGV